MDGAKRRFAPPGPFMHEYFANHLHCNLLQIFISPQQHTRKTRCADDMESVLVLHTTRGEPTPKPDTQPTLAYDRLQCQVLAAHLRCEDPAVKHAALVSLQRLVCDEKTVAKVHDAGLLDMLAELAAGHKVGSTISRLAAECIGRQLASPALRTRTFSRPAVADALRRCLAAGDEQLRLTACKAVTHVAEPHEGCEALLKADFVRDLVDRIRPELGLISAVSSFQVFLALLEALRCTVSHTETMAIDTALVCGAVPVLAHVVGSTVAGPAGESPFTAAERHESLRLAADIMMHLAFPSAGKRACLESEGAVDALLAALRTAPVEAGAACAGCLMNIAIEDGAKHALVSKGAVPMLSGLLVAAAETGSASGALYACKCLGILCSHPQAREQVNADPTALEVLHHLSHAEADAAGAAAIPKVGSIASAVGRSAQLCLEALRLPHEAP
jgi:hypothetical protein